MGNFKDLTGQRFGRLKVISRAENGQDGHARWLCLCNCGNLTIVCGTELTRKDGTKSCGCYKIEVSRECNTIHGHSKERLFRIWYNMVYRCTNSNHPEYHRYGGEGIKVCDEWRKSFEAFRVWALANGYADNLTIDRIDNNKGYFPENCRWVTMKEQQNNRSNNHPLTINGKTQTLAQHVADPEINVHGLKYATVLTRINRDGYTPKEAFSIPLRGKRKNQEGM